MRAAERAAPARPWGAYLALSASMALVGTYVALSRPLTAAIPVFALAFLRFAIGAVAMLPWTLRRAGEPPLSAHEGRLFFLMSFFGNFLFSICMLYGVSLTTATAAGVILGTLPAMVAVLSRVLLGERLEPRALLAIGLAIAGIGLLHAVRGDGDAGAAASRAWLGNLLMVATVACEALYVVIGKRLVRARSPLRVSALINLWGLALMAVPGLWQLSVAPPAAITPATWVLLVFYALAASLFSVWLWMTGLQRVPAHHAGVFTVALPIAATAVGVVFLGEVFTVLHGAALACAAAGVVLIARAAPAPPGH